MMEAINANAQTKVITSRIALRMLSETLIVTTPPMLNVRTRIARVNS